MDFLIKIWNWLDGKKTNLGALFLFLGMLLQTQVIGEWGYAGTWLPHVIADLNWAGGLLLPAGLGHQAYKIQQAKKGTEDDKPLE